MQERTKRRLGDAGEAAFWALGAYAGFELLSPSLHFPPNPEQQRLDRIIDNLNYDLDSGSPITRHDIYHINISVNLLHSGLSDEGKAKAESIIHRINGTYTGRYSSQQSRARAAFVYARNELREVKQLEMEYSIDHLAKADFILCASFFLVCGYCAIRSLYRAITGR